MKLFCKQCYEIYQVVHRVQQFLELIYKNKFIIFSFFEFFDVYNC